MREFTMPAVKHDKLLVFIPAEPDRAWIKKIESEYGIEVRWANARHPDGTIVRAEELDDKIWDGLTMIATYMPPPVKYLSNVRFVQLTSAGADKWLKHDLYKNENVIFCTANGIHPPQIAEWVIGTYLAFEHSFVHYAAQMKKCQWDKPYAANIRDSTGARMGILGYGAIGRQCARVAAAMGMEIYAYTRSSRQTPEARKDDSYCVPGTGDPDGLIPTKWFSGASKEAINDFLRQDLDILVISLPLTDETRGLISYEQFDILSRRKTFLSNIARGQHVNQEALIQALEMGQIRGAALDVTDPEPLPSDHPLWKAPNLLITPHVSWQTHKYWDRVLAILEINLERLNLGEPLINRVNRELHY